MSGLAGQRTAQKKYSVPKDIIATPSAEPHDADIDTAVLEEELCYIVHSEVYIANKVVGAAVTRYEFELEDESAVSRAMLSVGRIEDAVGAKNVRFTHSGTACAVEIPNRRRGAVRFEYSDNIRDGETRFTVGKDVFGSSVDLDLFENCNVLVAGVNGSGKSMFLNAMLLSLISVYSPENLELRLADCKHGVLTAYAGIPHIAGDIATDGEAAAEMLESLADETEYRSGILKQSGCNIDGYNSLPETICGRNKKLKRSAIVINGYDRMTKETNVRHRLEKSIARIVDCNANTGVFLVVASDSLELDVLTNVIRASFDTRAVFATEYAYPSRNLIGVSDGAALVGGGDMILSCLNKPLVRVQCPSVSKSDVRAVVGWIKDNVPADASAAETAHGSSAARGASAEQAMSQRADAEFMRFAAYYADNPKSTMKELKNKFLLSADTVNDYFDRLLGMGAIEVKATAAPQRLRGHDSEHADK